MIWPLGVLTSFSSVAHYRLSSFLIVLSERFPQEALLSLLAPGVPSLEGDSAGVFGPAVSLSLSVFHEPPALEEFSVDPESSCPISDPGEGPWNLLFNKVSSCPSASGS